MGTKPAQTEKNLPPPLTSRIWSTFIKHHTQRQQNMHYFQVAMERTRTHHILNHNTTINGFKSWNRTECFLTTVKSDEKSISGKSPNTWKLSNVLLSNQWVKEDISKEIKMWTAWKQKYNVPTFVRHSSSNACLTLTANRNANNAEEGKFHMGNLSSHLKQLETEEQGNPRGGRRRGL